MRALDADILRLAVPALGALAAEPLFLLADTAMVGHLGPDALGSMAIASTVLQTVLGLMIFLAYATTPRVAHSLGRNDTAGAVSAGFDGMWLALVTSLVLLAVGLPLVPTMVGWFHPSPETVVGAVSYLRISWIGLPFMLVVIAATGLLRGLQDTRTPLVVAGAGFLVNIALNALFIYGFGLGLAGSALGSVCAQAGMCAVYVVIAWRAARRYGASIRPHASGLLSSASASAWLLLRNVSLRAALIVLVVLATALGTEDLAAVQIVQTLFFSLAMVLDSLAIAGQAIVGLELGRNDRARVRAVTNRLIVWGIAFGALVGVVLLLGSPFLGRLFTSDEVVAALLVGLMVLLALAMPLAGYVFTLDGILMGAGDSRYLALAQAAAFCGFAVLCLLVYGTWTNVYVLWGCFCLGFLLLRAAGLGIRARGEAWIDRAVARGTGEQ